MLLPPLCQSISSQLHRCGLIAIVGRPNVGKSSLMNALVKQKISIVSHKPQTTRHQIRGIISDAESQLVFLDTPGLHLRAKTGQMHRALNQHLNATAMQAFTEADVVLMLVEAGVWTRQDAQVLQAIKGVVKDHCPPLLVGLNKIDKLHNKRDLLPLLEACQQRLLAQQLQAELLPLSVLKQDNLDELLHCLKQKLPTAEPMYEVDTLTDKSERFLCGEIIREKFTQQLHQELPYGMMVVIEQFQQADAMQVVDSRKIDQCVKTIIHASVVIERQSQKSMVIGKGGAVIKRIRQQAQVDIAKLLQQPTDLYLWVKVKRNWLDDQQFIQQL